ncbi:LANO_0E02432g1_1 [Lachancea nothofagi CBS 11611]|uniref:LANO_0E02432g1_1 n=1 Tax=Lachancea nothofagi CBS 11611 TaxID=1266666 RepID=A0A1G4JQI0_9SACH|nr:LANO_0E02432g1_1 [Lachancea nothofagi CBS 11611]
MGESRSQDGIDDEKNETRGSEPKMDEFGRQVSKVSQERFSNRSRGNLKEGEGGKTRLLNAYGLTPSTVPPFALDEELKSPRLRIPQNQDQTTQPTGNKQQQHQHQNQQQLGPFCKDPFLVSHNGNWGPFVENVGSNVSYLHKAADESEVGQNYNNLAGVSSSDSSKGETSSSSDEPKQGRASKTKTSLEANDQLPPTFPPPSKNVLADLSGSWGGSERLNAIFNGPLLDSHKFTNNQDRQDWTEYLESVKAFYYREGPLNRDLEAGLQGEGALTDGNDNDNNKLHSFLEKQRTEFKQKRKHWRQLERQKKQKWVPTLRKVLLDNQYLPLGLRMLIVILSIIALALAIRIYQNSNSRIEQLDSRIPQQASTIMALCVNSIAVLYLFYISYDEFSGKPLGLRNPFGKMRLILLDMLFIIFSSANLALTFNTLYDRQWVCTPGEYTSTEVPKIDYICRKQRALASFLFVVLFMWVVTFALSILRVVEKMNSSSAR